jgi:predicted nucleic acid-binding protein
VIVVDSSAWIELIRATGSPVHRRLHAAIAAREPLAVTEMVVGEVLAGVVVQSQLRHLHRMLLSFPVLPLGGLAGFEQAARLARTCRIGGESLRRGLGDCLVAVPAIRAGAPVLHSDRDFEVLARHTELQLVAAE